MDISTRDAKLAYEEFERRIYRPFDLEKNILETAQMIGERPNLFSVVRETFQYLATAFPGKNTPVICNTFGELLKVFIPRLETVVRMEVNQQYSDRIIALEDEIDRLTSILLNEKGPWKELNNDDTNAG